MKIWDIVSEDFEKTNDLDENLKKKLATAAIVGSTMFGAKAKGVSDTTSINPKNISSIESKMVPGINTEILIQWNDYIRWLKTNTDKDGLALSGNDKMNNVNFSKSTLEAYNNQNKASKLNYNMVKSIQSQIKKYRDHVISSHKSGKKVNFDFSPTPDYSNFMSWVTGTDVDGINGKYTSQFMFPKEYLVNLNNSVRYDLGFAKNK
jgi:hypothetical protein